MDKTCFKCGVSKARSEFYKHAQMGDGLLGKCKACAKSDVIANRTKHVEYYRAYDRLRFYENGARGACSVDASRRGKRAWQEANGEKRASHYKVQRAVQSGKLTKPLLCESCHQQRPLHGHHDDYSKPLDVRWLCSPCHRAHHRKYDEESTRAIVLQKRKTSAP